MQTMKHILITIIAAVVLVGCGESLKGQSPSHVVFQLLNENKPQFLHESFHSIRVGLPRVVYHENLHHRNFGRVERSCQNESWSSRICPSTIYCR